MDYTCTISTNIVDLHNRYQSLIHLWKVTLHSVCSIVLLYSTITITNYSKGGVKFHKCIFTSKTN